MARFSSSRVYLQECLLDASQLDDQFLIDSFDSHLAKPLTVVIIDSGSGLVLRIKKMDRWMLGIVIDCFGLFMAFDNQLIWSD